MLRRIVSIAEAYCYLLAWDLFMRKHSFLELYQAIRAVPVAAGRTRLPRADEVYDAVEIACALYPKQILCLQRSCVLTRMLRTRGVAAQLAIGSQRNPFRAHAWVMLHGQVIRDRLAQRESFLILEVC